MNDIIGLVRDGITVNVAFDMESSIILGAVIFGALVLALAFYAKVLQ